MRQYVAVVLKFEDSLVILGQPTFLTLFCWGKTVQSTTHLKKYFPAPSKKKKQEQLFSLHNMADNVRK